MDNTKYDEIVNWLLNHWTIAIFVLIMVVIAFVPQVLDGIKALISFFSPDETKDEESDSKSDDKLTMHFDGETVTIDELIISHDFDVVKINAVTHRFGVIAEYEWLKQKLNITCNY